MLGEPKNFPCKSLLIPCSELMAVDIKICERVFEDFIQLSCERKFENKWNTFLTGKLDAARAFMIIGILLHGLAFLLLLAAQVLKKDIFQKTLAPVFWSICKSNFSCCCCLCC